MEYEIDRFPTVTSKHASRAMDGNSEGSEDSEASESTGESGDEGGESAG